MKDWPWYGYFLLALIIVGLFYFLYYKGKNEELRSLREERIRTESQIVELRAKKRQMDQIEQEIKEMQATLSQLETLLIEATRPKEFIE